MRKSVFFLTFLTGSALPIYAFAETKTWKGFSSNRNWSYSQNWSPSGAPNPGDTIIFNGGSGNSGDVNMDFVSFVPASMTFSGVINIDFVGSGVFTVGTTAGCPKLFCNLSNGIWTSGTILNINGPLELSTTAGTSLFQFAGLTGSGDLTVDANVTTTFIEPNAGWTASNITINGIVNLNTSDTLPQAAVTLGGSAQWNTNGNSVSIGGLNGNGTVNLSSASSGGSLTTNGTGTYSGTIRNGTGTVKPGSVTIGGFTQTFTGNNTYSGGTAISSGGTLALSGSGSLSSVGTVDILSGGMLDISPLSSPAISIIGPLAGSGNVSLGANTLEVNSGSTNTTFSGPLTDSGGGGGLIKTGTAVLSLTGTNNYLGPTQVNQGTLVIGVGGIGSLANSSVTINSGGTLQGTGTILETVTVQSGGTISGGNSIGTISIGTLALNSGANLTLEINSSGASTVYDVTNTATLAGNLAVTVDRGNYQAGTIYTFISTGASGRIGTFDTVTSNTFGTTTLTGRLDYGTDFVKLVLFSPIYAIIPLDGLSGNAKVVAEYLNGLSSYPEIQPVLLAVGALPTEEAKEALDSISPARNAISSWTAQNVLFGINQVAVNRMLQQRYMRWIESHEPAVAIILDEEENFFDFEDRLLASQELLQKQKAHPYGKTQTIAKEESYYAVWAEGLGFFAGQNAINENPVYNSSTGCGLIGADFYNFTHGQMGAAIGYAQSSIQESDTGKGSIQFYLAGLYGTAYIDDGYVELGLWSSFDQFFNTRDVIYPGFSKAAHSNHNGWQLVPHIGGGYDFNFDWGAIEPFATFDAAALFQQGYSEHGADVLNMRIKSSTSWLLRGEVGLNAYQVVHMASSHLIFRETLSYVNLAPFGIGKMANAALVGFPPGFTVNSFTDVQNMIAPGFELFFKCLNGFFFSLAYEGEFTIGDGNYMSNECIGKMGCFF